MRFPSCCLPDGFCPFFFVFFLFFFLKLIIINYIDPVVGTVHSTSQNALETHNLALASTFLVQGVCTGIVFAIGDKSIMGRIVAMSGETKFKMTTIQKYVFFASFRLVFYQPNPTRPNRM